MPGIMATYEDAKDIVQMRHPEFPKQSGELVFNRIRFKAMETMPRGMRLIHHWSRHASNITFVFEERPTMRLIQYMKKEYYIPTPWVVYFLTLQNNRLWVDRILYSTHSVRSVDEVLKIPVLPNIYIEPKSFCKVCPASEAMTLLEIREGAIRYDLTIGSAIASFWASHFNEELTGYRAYLPMPYVQHSFTGMEALDELTICDVPWAPAASIRHMLSQMEWGSSIETQQPMKQAATAFHCFYQEFNTAVTMDSYEDVIAGAPRGSASDSGQRMDSEGNVHPDECDCGECYCMCEECIAERSVE